MLEIELPTEFNASHERAVIDYLSNRLSGRVAWAQVFAAFDILDQAILVIEEEQINGDTVAGDLETLIHQFPAPISIQHRGHDLVVLDYDEWKRRILRRQGAAE